MPIEITHIAVDGLSCVECDCGACLSSAVAALKAIGGVVHVGVDRRGMTFVVRHDGSVADEAALRTAVLSSGLSITESGT